MFDEVRRELGEELSFGPSDIGGIACVGLVEDQALRQPELIFITRSTRRRAEIEAQVDKKEHDASWCIATDRAMADGVLAAPAELTPVAVATVLLWGKEEFGEGWFRGHVESRS